MQEPVRWADSKPGGHGGLGLPMVSEARTCCGTCPCCRHLEGPLEAWRIRQLPNLRKGCILGWRTLWLCHLMGKAQMLVRRAGDPLGPVYVALAAPGGLIVSAWPAERVTADGRVYRFQRAVSWEGVGWLVVDTHEGWEASVLRWYSPVAAAMNELPDSGVLMFAVEWSSLLVASAKLAFCGMSFAQLGLLVLEYCGLDVILDAR